MTLGFAFKRETVLRLVRLTVGIAASVAMLIYVLAWAGVPMSVAAGWTGQVPVPVERVDVLGQTVSFPVGPYLWIAALLAILATVGFLAFVLTEDKYSHHSSAGE